MVDIMGPIYGVLNAIFNPILAIDPNPANPALTVLIIAFIVSLITTVANKYLVDQDELNEKQKAMQEFNKELREAQKRGDGKKIAELQAKQADMMKDQTAMMTDQFKPMIVTFVPIILIFFWMRTSAIHNLVIILPKTVYWVTLTPLWHVIGSFVYGGKATIPYGIGWLLWYMICTFGMSQILRKYLGFKQGF
ncbi:DUF106 domain-containing protein [Methanobrevibacter sp.]|jgi:uncharacterized membrane protein (DUF106 family)|uniref:DUF106 domain-containing protein n=1 Tax=Methanobrevibacter sp. TaxID=66852 RepID=UPI00386EA4A1